MTYKYLYQDKQNRNCEGEIKAWDRNDAYLQLRKQGIRPYRVIGDDPLNWRPWAIAAGYAVLLALVFVLAAMLAGRAHPSAPPAPLFKLHGPHERRSHFASLRPYYAALWIPDHPGRPVL